MPQCDAMHVHTHDNKMDGVWCVAPNESTQSLRARVDGCKSCSKAGNLVVVVVVMIITRNIRSKLDPSLFSVVVYVCIAIVYHQVRLST